MLLVLNEVLLNTCRTPPRGRPTRSAPVESPGPRSARRSARRPAAEPGPAAALGSSADTWNTQRGRSAPDDSASQVLTMMWKVQLGRFWCSLQATSFGFSPEFYISASDLSPKSKNVIGDALQTETLFLKWCQRSCLESIFNFSKFWGIKTLSIKIKHLSTGRNKMSSDGDGLRVCLTNSFNNLSALREIPASQNKNPSSSFPTSNFKYYEA